MNNPYMPYNPYNYSTTNSSLIRVTGIEGAKAYQMPANSVAPLFDANEDVFYIKTTDGAGFPTIRSFSFKEIEQDPRKHAGEYVSREEFEELRKEIEEYGKQLVQPAKATRAEKS